MYVLLAAGIFGSVLSICSFSLVWFWGLHLKFDEKNLLKIESQYVEVIIKICQATGYSRQHCVRCIDKA